MKKTTLNPAKSTPDEREGFRRRFQEVFNVEVTNVDLITWFSAEQYEARRAEMVGYFGKRWYQILLDAVREMKRMSTEVEIRDVKAYFTDGIYGSDHKEPYLLLTDDCHVNKMSR